MLNERHRDAIYDEWRETCRVCTLFQLIGKCSASIVATLLTAVIVSFGTATEPHQSHCSDDEPMLSFNGVDVNSWKHGGNWNVSEKSLSCFKLGDGDNDLHYLKPLPQACEVTFEWKVDKTNRDSTQLNPGLSLNYNVGVPGCRSRSYGAGVDYHISGLDVRIHTRSIEDESPIANEFSSGMRQLWPKKDQSKPIGQWNRSRIVCGQSRVEFWLNGQRAAVLDVEQLKFNDKHLDDKISSLVKEEWVTAKRGQLFVSVIAPSAEEFMADNVQIRSISVQAITE